MNRRKIGCVALWIMSISAIVSVCICLAVLYAPATIDATEAKPVEASLSASPNSPLSGMVIGVNAGHQGKANLEEMPLCPDKDAPTKVAVNGGATGVNSGISEYKINLQVSLMLRDWLEALGTEVTMIRTSNDINIANSQRAIIMSNAGAMVALNIHCNASGNKQPNGTDIYASANYAVPKQSRQLAQCILDEFVEATGSKKRRVILNDDYAYLNWATVPSVLVEMGFLSNPDEEELLIDLSYQRKCVEGIISGVAKYLKVELPKGWVLTMPMIAYDGAGNPYERVVTQYPRTSER